MYLLCVLHLQKFLYSRFSEFGLIYDMRIFASNFEHASGQMTYPETDEKELTHENGTATSMFDCNI